MDTFACPPALVIPNLLTLTEACPWTCLITTGLSGDRCTLGWPWSPPPDLLCSPCLGSTGLCPSLVKPLPVPPCPLVTSAGCRLTRLVEQPPSLLLATKIKYDEPVQKRVCLETSTYVCQKHSSNNILYYLLLLKLLDFVQGFFFVLFFFFLRFPFLFTVVNFKYAAQSLFPSFHGLALWLFYNYAFLFWKTYAHITSAQLRCELMFSLWVVQVLDWVVRSSTFTQKS